MRVKGTEKKSDINSRTEIVVVVSTYYSELVTDGLFQSCVETLISHGVIESKIRKIEVPGSYELVAGALFAAKNYSADAVICLGCVIKGETDHDSYINHAVAQGLVQLQLRFEKPFTFGLVTTNTEEQAISRSSANEFNKGREAALASLGMIELFQSGSL